MYLATSTKTLSISDGDRRLLCRTAVCLLPRNERRLSSVASEKGLRTMSSITTTSVLNQSRIAGRASLLRLSAATVVAAVATNAVFYFVAGLFVSYHHQFAPLANVSGAVIFTAFFAVGAVLLYALLRRVTQHANRIFAVISAVFLAVSVIPDLTYIPTVSGASAAQTAVLIVMHVFAAAVIVGMLLTGDSETAA
jgi:uncharacterized protein DUF6069